MDIAPETSVSETGTVYTVQYAVNGVLHSITISNDSEWDAFMQTVFALSREGYDVRIINGAVTFHADCEIMDKELAEIIGTDLIPAGRYQASLTTYKGDSVVCVNFGTTL